MFGESSILDSELISSIFLGEDWCLVQNLKIFWVFMGEG